MRPRRWTASRSRRRPSCCAFDPEPYQLAVDQLESQVAQARIELERLRQEKANIEASLQLAEEEVAIAERDRDRQEKLYQARSDSEASFDRARLALVGSRNRAQTIRNQLAVWPQHYAAAESRLRQLEIQLADAKLRLADCSIRAPFAGRVIERLVEVGQFVNVGTPVLRVYDSSIMEAPVRVPIEDFQWIDTAPLMAAMAAERPSDAAPAGAPRATLRYRAGDRVFAWDGVVARLDARIDRATRTAGMVVEIADAWRPESGPPLVPGLFVEVEIEARTLADAVRIPRAVITQEGYVYLAAGDRLERRAVHVARTLDGEALVDRGLVTGDRLVLTPLATPVEGMHIRIEGEAALEPVRAADRAEPADNEVSN